MIVGFSGRIGHGKDTAAQRLIERGFFQVRFSDGLKAEVVTRLPLTVRAIADLHGIPREESLERLVYLIKPRGIRELLQEYGTEVRRGDDPDYWVKRWAESAAIHTNVGESVVATDVRFPNELRAVRENGGLSIKVVRSCAPDTGTHVSETALDGWTFDAVLQNDGTKEDLWDAVDRELARWS